MEATEGWRSKSTVWKSEPGPGLAPPRAAPKAVRSQPPLPGAAELGQRRAAFFPRGSAELGGAGQVLLGWGLLRVRVSGVGGSPGGGGLLGERVLWGWGLLQVRVSGVGVTWRWGASGGEGPLGAGSPAGERLWGESLWGGSPLGVGGSWEWNLLEEESFMGEDLVGVMGLF